MDNQEDINKTPTPTTPKPAMSFEALPTPTKKNSASSSLTKPNYPDFSKIPSSDKLLRGILLILAVILIGFGAGWLGAYTRNNDNPTSLSTAKEIVSSQNQLVTAIAKADNPSVVAIQSNTTTQTQTIFGGTVNTPEESEGTGIIISSSGYVITNRHVVPAGTTSVTVTLADGTTINNVKVVGETSSSDTLDIAFLKISGSPEPLVPALLGNSSDVQIGDSVVAIGNALGEFQNTVTSGIISGLGRTIQAGDENSSENENLEDLIQTSAAINPGNSGGPLINSSGQVIGIDTALASDAQNIGFAIPINDADGLIKGVLATGTLERPYLGVYYVSINPATAKQYGLSVKNGAYIPPNQSGQPSIIAGSPAATAGLQPDDIILAVNGVSVNDTTNTLSTLIDENEVGAHLTLTVLRSGSQKQITVTVGLDPSN